MLANLNAGHTLTGADVGTRGLNGSKEEILTRQLVKELEKEFKAKGHKTNSVIVDHAATLDESLNKQVILCNRINANMNIVIHFNSYLGKGYGTEIYTYRGKYLPEADRVLKNMSKLGFRNRGIKNAELALINRTKAETLYIEVCFIDNPTDVAILNKYGLNTIAKAIVCGVLNIEFNVNGVSNNSNNNWYSLDGKLGIVTATSGLNVRQSKSTNSKILGVLTYGEKVRLFKKDGEWISIYYPEHGGYVSSDYIEIL